MQEKETVIDPLELQLYLLYLAANGSENSVEIDANHVNLNRQAAQALDEVARTYMAYVLDGASRIANARRANDKITLADVEAFLQAIGDETVMAPQNKYLSTTGK